MDSFRMWPEWWEWEIEYIPHLLKRMVDREFNETDLRTMLAEAYNYMDQPDGRYLILTHWDDQPWAVVVEPDSADRVLLVITAYPRD
jgi:hypothetical protein